MAMGVRLARPAAIGTDDAIVINADGDGLRVAEPACGRMAAGAGVVIIQPGDGIKPKQTAKIGSRRICRTTEALFECSFNVAGKTELFKPRH